MLEPLPTLRPPQPPATTFARGFPARVALDWLAAGWRDLRMNPLPSLIWGVMLFLLSWTVLWALRGLGLLYLALPAMAGFLIVGPFLAVGLYEKSRSLSAGRRASFSDMLRARPASSGQFAYAGLMLGLLVLFWLRAADLLYALFFGLFPFPGAEDALTNLLFEPRGWALIMVGTAVGGIFASFAFSLSLFSLPMLLSERQDAMTSMGLSFAMTTQNLAPCLAWGVIVTLGMVLSIATGFLALIIVFPVLGHGTWHAYQMIGKTAT